MLPSCCVMESWEMVSESFPQGLLSCRMSLKVALDLVDRLLLILSDLAVGRCSRRINATRERIIMTNMITKNSEESNLAWSVAAWMKDVPFSRVTHTGFPPAPCARAAKEGTKPLIPSPIK